LGALAGCAVAFVTDTLAPQFDVEINEMTATARCSSDLAGLLGVADADPMLHGITIEIHITSPSPRDRIRAMQEAWLQRCPVYLALRTPTPLRCHSGEVHRVAPIGNHRALANSGGTITTDGPAVAAVGYLAATGADGKGGLHPAVTA